MRLKKQSNTSNRRLPEFVLDENLSSEVIVKDMRLFPEDWIVNLHVDRFVPRTPDEKLLKECGLNGWILITKDDKMRNVPESRASAERYGTKVFVFSRGGQYKRKEYAAAVVYRVIP